MVDEKDLEVTKKVTNTKTGESHHTIKSIKGGTKAFFENGTLARINTGGDVVHYVNDAASSVVLKSGLVVTFNDEIDGKGRVTGSSISVWAKDKNGEEIDIAATRQGQAAIKQALDAQTRADGFLDWVAKDTNLRDLPAFVGLKNWQNRANERFNLRLKLREARKKMAKESSEKRFASPEQAINAGASVEAVNRARAKDEQYVADRATWAAKEGRKQAAEDRAKAKKEAEKYAPAYAVNTVDGR